MQSNSGSDVTKPRNPAFSPAVNIQFFDVIFHLFLTSLFFNSVHVYACACVSAGMNLMIATLRTSTIVGWEGITLYLIFATRLSTLIQLRHLIGPLQLKSFYNLFLVWVSEAVNFSMRLFICEFSPPSISEHNPVNSCKTLLEKVNISQYI